MKSNRVAIIHSKSPVQQKTYEIREREDGKYELNMICPASYNFGIFDNPGDCKRKANIMNPLGTTCKRL